MIDLIFSQFLREILSISGAWWLLMILMMAEILHQFIGNLSMFIRYPMIYSFFV